MAEFVDTRRNAPWWMCALMLLIAAFFGWVIYETQSKPVSAGVWNHVIIPPYAVWIYLVLICLLNRQRIHVTRERIVVSNGPIPYGPKEVIPREQIAFCYYYSVMVGADDGGDESFPIGHVPGVETTEGRQVVLLEALKDIDSARNFATAVATALNDGAVGDPVPVKRLDVPRTDPVGTRRSWVWAGVWAGAFGAGTVWEIVHRWPA